MLAIDCGALRLCASLRFWEETMANSRGTGEALDVITIGRSSVDLYGQQIGSRLEDIA